MKTKRAILFSVVMSVAFLCNACSEFDSGTDVVEMGYYPPYPNILNASNPYDSIGMWHNAICSFSLRRAKADTSAQTFLEKTLKAAAEFADSSGVEIQNQDTLINAGKWLVLDNQNRDWPEYLSAFEDAELTEKEIHYINRLGSAMVDAETLSDIEDSLLQIEDDIVAESWQSDEPFALVSIAIAKHSYYFWVDVLDADGLNKSTTDPISIGTLLITDVSGFVSSAARDYVLEDGNIDWGRAALVGAATSFTQGITGLGSTVCGAIVAVGETIWEFFF